jgi:AcrR family transcriptional regulator
MTKRARRHHLLDVAAEILLEEGAGSLTMEKLGLRAGVSKALPYAHFSNSDDVLAALLGRELAGMGTRVLEAVEGERPREEQVRRAVHAYFDVVAERGAILSLLIAPGSRVRRARTGERAGPTFVAALFERWYPVSGRRAMLGAELVLALLGGAVTSWARRDAPRAVIEELVVAAIIELGERLSADAELPA